MSVHRQAPGSPRASPASPSRVSTARSANALSPRTVCGERIRARGIIHVHLVAIAAVGAAALLTLIAFAWPQATPPLVNVALTANGTRVVADTQYGDHVSGANAADGQIGHGTVCWFSRDWTKLPCALTFEFVQPERLRRAVLHQAQWSGSMYHTRDFALEVSPDGRTWTRVGTGSLADDNLANAALDLNVETKWFRVVILTSYVPFQTCGLAEVELLAERPGAVGSPTLTLNGSPATVSEDTGYAVLAHAGTGPQVLVGAGSNELVADLRSGESLVLTAPVSLLDVPGSVSATVRLIGGTDASVEMECDGKTASVVLQAPGSAPVEIGSVGPGEREAKLTVTTVGGAQVRVGPIGLSVAGRAFRSKLTLAPTDYGSGAPPVTPQLRPAIERELIRLDWQAQDGVGTPREPIELSEAIHRVRRRGEALASRVRPDDGPRRAAIAEWRRAVAALPSGSAANGEESLRDAYLRLREAKRALLLAQARESLKPIVFAKRVPSAFSHQLTQYYGRYARPGGGIYLLEEPGKSMGVRRIVDVHTPSGLPLGSCMHPEVAWDGKTILFAHSPADRTPEDTIQGARGRYYSLYSVRPDGTGLKRLTDGPYDDFAPRYLPDGGIVFISTRRGGWHRCGTPGCENYVLTVARADGKDPRPISFHETQEWDPAVLPDGRIVYTRWDYVDRHPVFYEHLWTTAPDGTRAAALFGNNTFNPVGIWEARPVPGTRKLIATAAAHHAMTAGSIILLDPSRGVDGLKPITRLTPDAPFPESETTVPGSWYAPMPGTEPYDTEENRRWPGHCYRSPYPLGNGLFLAAYSFRQLIGEPRGNPANMFGIYLCDSDGNKELLYRDPSIASLWPAPLTARPRPPVVASSLRRELGDTGVFVLQNVYAAKPGLPRGSVKALRIVQVLPKSTPGKDMPPIGIPSGAPGKQVLGTVPVEADGSAHFVAPARRELAFQALDGRGMAVQIMRSGVYVQPGERITCVGCHEPRGSSPPSSRPKALLRPPSRIAPGPDGTRPFSYPILVQKLLDQRCVSCHSGPKAPKGIVLTGEPEGHYSRSYNALAPRVPFSDMGNGEAISKPGRYGAHGSPLMKMLLQGHQGVKLSQTEIERLATWMDVSVLFYGTFDPAEQERQRRGERIACPKLE